MDPSAKKARKKKNNSKKPDNDPIIRKKTKANPPKEANLVKSEPPAEESPSNQKEAQAEQPLLSEYEKLLRKYKIKKADLSEKFQGSSVRKLPPNEIQLLTGPKINFTEKSGYRSYRRHFEQEHKDLTDRIIEEGSKSSDPTSKTSSELMEKFSFVGQAGKGPDRPRSEKDILNNDVKIRNFTMRKEFKREKTEFSSDYFEKLVADRNAREFIRSEGVDRTPAIQQKIAHIMKQEDFDGEDLEVLKYLNEYLDFIYVGNEEDEFLKVRKVWMTHLLNHILNGHEEFKSVSEGGGEKETAKTKGFTRCKVLILAPYKRDGYEVILADFLIKSRFFKIIMDMIEYFSKGTLKKTSHKSRFSQEFGIEDAETQDDFKIGLNFANKNINLYTPFANSDIIVASPLGLRLVTGAAGDEKREFSFLSSIELLIIDQAHTLYMQNWHHLEEILQILNKTPKYKDMTSSLDEIREYHFENMSKFYRQTIVSTQYNFPELNSIHIRYFNNYKGCLETKLTYLPLVLESLNNFTVEFMKLEVNSYEEDFEKRFELFKNKIWLKVNDRQDMSKTVIFVNSYYEFIKLRNYFKKTNSFVQYICEYTSKGSVQSRLSQFNKKNIPFLLISERAYFFKICELKNACNIIFYSLPKNEYIYKNLIMSLQDPQDHKAIDQGPSFKNKVKCIFSKYDALFLEKIVGTEGMREFLAEYNKASTFIL